MQSAKQYDVESSYKCNGSMPLGKLLKAMGVKLFSATFDFSKFKLNEASRVRVLVEA